MTEDELMNELKVVDLRIDFARHGTPEENMKSATAIRQRLQDLNVVQGQGTYTEAPLLEIKRLVGRVLRELFAMDIK